MNEQVTKKQLSFACRYSYARLALNYYMYCDMMLTEEKNSAQIEQFQQSFYEQMESFLKGEAREEGVAKLRAAIKKYMERLSFFTDTFEIYESVLNRMEGRFLETFEPEEDEELFISRLLHYLTDAKESVVVNSRIQSVVAELPIRLTRSKFAELVSEGLSAYIGSDKTALKTCLYLLESAAMMKLEEGEKDAYPYLTETLTEFQKADYKNLSKEEFQKLQARLAEVVDYLEYESSKGLMLQDMINDLYVLVLSKKEAFLDLEEQNLLQHIYRSLNEFMSCDSKQNGSFLESLEDDIFQLEGKQESCYERYLRHVGEWSEEWKETGRKIDLLLSGSSFADLEEGEEEMEKADRAYVNRETERFLAQLNAYLSTLQKPVSRAVMAKILSLLPVFFNSVNEIQAYVQGSLESCLDEVEKRTCMELIGELMERDNALV
ncbi:MAG: hypothetical protein Q4D90_04745 [bacterium]|nr:hypothetical protein [bacterium]